MGLKRFILWDYERATWPYDVICVVIFVFHCFYPAPVVPRSTQNSAGEPDYLVAQPWRVGILDRHRTSFLLSGEPAARSVRAKFSPRGPARPSDLTRIEPILDSEQEIKGYMAFAKP